LTAVEEEKPENIGEVKERKCDEAINLLKLVIEKLNAIEVNQNTHTDEIRSLKQALSTGFQPKREKPEVKWRPSKSGRSEWIHASEDPELAKRLDANGWKSIGDYIYRLSEDGQFIRRMRKVRK
jgi:hypothetical protein